MPPKEVFARLRSAPGCCWLDSGNGSGKQQRYSVLAAFPFQTLTAYGNRIEKRIGDEVTHHAVPCSLGYLESELTKYQSEDAELPMAGGAIGHFSYEFGFRLAGLSSSVGRALRWPDFCFHFFAATYVFDHLESRGSFRAIDTDLGRAGLKQLRTALEQVEEKQALAGPAAPFSANRSRENYCAAVEGIREAIASGEIYQANLAQFFSTPFTDDSAVLFSRLRDLNPAPYGAYINAGDRAILSSSPEQFLRIDSDRRIVTRPIKGTRPRGRSSATDRRLRDDLFSSTKERAELLMIVDMERNDLGRIAEFGSVQVNELYCVESYATVHHLVGEVEAKLRSEIGLREIMRATFPGGSITGAPKIQAMKVIQTLEPTPRDVFCGSIGWLGFDGTMELNIAIRTIVCQEGRADFGVGAGIVWDSVPDAEFQETLHKAQALFAALQSVRG